MNVGDFLELKCSLFSNGMVYTATEKKRVIALNKVRRKCADFSVLGNGGRHSRGQFSDGLLN